MPRTYITAIGNYNVNFFCHLISVSACVSELGLGFYFVKNCFLVLGSHKGRHHTIQD